LRTSLSSPTSFGCFTCSGNTVASASIPLAPMILRSIRSRCVSSSMLLKNPTPQTLAKLRQRTGLQCRIRDELLEAAESLLRDVLPNRLHHRSLSPVRCLNTIKPMNGRPSVSGLPILEKWEAYSNSNTVQGISSAILSQQLSSSNWPPNGNNSSKTATVCVPFPRASTKSPSKTAKFCRGTCAKAYTLTAFSGIFFKTIINYISCLCQHKMFFSRLEVEVGEQEDQAQPGDQEGSERKQELLHPPDCSGFTQTMMYSP